MAEERNGEAVQNVVYEIGKSHGFDPLPSEWWHFDFRGWQRFELMDVPIEEATIGGH